MRQFPSLPSPGPRRRQLWPAFSVALGLTLCVAVTLAPELAVGMTYGGDALLLRPQAHVPVQLKTLHVTLQQPAKSTRWLIEARYTLLNRGAHDQQLLLTLPEPGCDSDKRTCRSATAGRFHNVQTTLDGQPLTPAAAQQPDKSTAKPKTGDPQAPSAPRARRFVVPIKAKKQAVLVQRYELERTTDGTGELVQLDFGPPKRWHGPIAKLSVKLSTCQRPWAVGYTRAYKLSQYSADIPTEGPMKGVATTRLQFFMRRVRPKTPLQIHLTTTAQESPARRCPDLQAVATAAKSKQAEAELKQILVMRELAELKRCRSLYLALYGFPFGSKTKRARFYGNPVASSQLNKTVLQGKKPYLRFGLRQNPTYVADLHPPMHQAYLSGLAKEIARRSNK